MTSSDLTRRRFIIKACWMTLGIGAFTAGVSVKACPYFLSAPQPGDIASLDGQQKDRLAFVEAVYPLFTMSELATILEVVIHPEKDWEIIEHTFFVSFDNQNDKPFYAFSLKQREHAIAEYLNSEHKEQVQAFDASRIRIMHSIVENGFFPYASFGYPDVRAEPFIADPSWEICHHKPSASTLGS